MEKSMIGLLALIAAAMLASCSAPETPRVAAWEPAPQLAAQERRSALAGAAPLRLLRTIPLPGVEGRFDHFALDARRQHLFVAALGNDMLEVLDLRSGKRLRSLRGLSEPTGVAFVAPSNRVFAASGEGAQCAILDGATFAEVGSAPGLPDADNVRYDEAARQIYVGYGDGALGILDAATGQRLGDIPLAAHPEAFQLERFGRRIFVNVPGAGHIAVIDRLKRAVVATWPTQGTPEGARSNFPMALDEVGHRLFIGCRSPARVLVYDTSSGKVVTALEIGGDTDDLFFDAARKRLYVSCGSGEINVFQARDTNHYALLATIPTAPGARTSFFSPDFDRLYLAVPHRGEQAAEIRLYAAAPSTVPQDKPGKLLHHAQRQQ